MIKQSTTRNLMVFLTDSTDHVTGLTGATLTIALSKNGAAFGAITPVVTERGDGWYSLAMTTSHTDTLGDLVLHITAASADPIDLREQVFALLPGDSVVVASIAANAVNASALATDAVTEIQTGLATSSVLAAVKAQTDLLPANPAAVGSAMTLTTAERGDIADKVLNRNVSGGSDAGRTVKQALHFLRNRWAVAAGTLTVYDTDDTTPSWTGTVTGTPGADPITGNDPA
jgi:hypothetical protein